MKVLFVDCDGVLNSTRSAYSYKILPYQPRDKEFDPLAILMLKNFCEEFGAVCVLSSSWRYSFDYEIMKERLELPFIGSTPLSKGYRPRGEEIQEWLDTNEHLGIDNYIILDDVGGMLEEQQYHFVQTDANEGLSYKDLKKMYNIFGGKMKPIYL